MSRGLLRFDGGCRPRNPGHAAFASVLETNGKTHVVSRYIGIRTNNYAEYMGLVVGVKLALTHHVRDLEIITDSQLIEGQIAKAWKVKSVDLRVLHGEASKLLLTHYGELGERWELRWERRDNNSVADNYCTEAINWGRNLNPFTPQSVKDQRGVGRVRDPFQ